jgi:phage tail-like protein
MSVGARIDPFSSFLFSVEIHGLIEGYFRECSGLESTIQVQEDAQAVPGQMRKLPGRIVYANIVLKWGLTKSNTLYQWHLQAINGTVARKNGSILQLDPTGHKELARWNFTDGWPTKYTGPSYNSSGNDIAVETLEIAHEKLERV